ncbi:hypothetical protein MPTA5024_24325 [Microbispora sp. ATCC PTA-5024]|nr:hypothetical protein MPTA5024_24325 [Microbispora sp. ATCC PTA-5024]
MTGGAGFIGANLCRALTARPEIEHVTVPDDLSPGNEANLDGVPVDLVKGSVLDDDLLVALVPEAACVVHLAARPSVPRSVRDPLGSHTVNATGTLSVLEACRPTRPHLVLASSSSVYGDHDEPCKHEDLPARPASPHGAAKPAAEAYALAYARRPLTVVWMVLITNSFNLLDNMDGALGATAAAGAGFLAATAFATGRPGTGLLLSALGCAALGFLPRNWAPAKIFMGDAGSLFIGFLLAGSAALLCAGWGPAGAAGGLLLPTLVATVDTCVVLLARRREGRPLLSGGLDHVSHRLRGLGLSTRLTALALAAAAAASGAVELLAALARIPALPALAAAAAAAALSVVLALAAPVRTPGGRPRPARIRERRP